MIEALPKKEPKTANWIYEAIRGLLAMSVDEEISDFSYTAVVGGEIRQFGYRAGNADIMCCESCDSEKFTMAQNGPAIDIICSECKCPFGVMEPR